MIAKFVIEYNMNENQLLLVLRNWNGKQIIEKYAIMYVLCMMSLMLVPQQYYETNKSLEDRFHHIKNFAYIFTSVEFKTIAIIEYLKLQLNQFFVNSPNNANNCKQIVIIQRVSLPQNQRTPSSFLNDLIKHSHKQQKLHMLKIEQDSNNIQQYYTQLKVDFANKYIGGGSLTFGAVQQQIMFAIHPQLYVAMLLCQKIEDYEILAFYGFKKYFDVQGYGYNVQIKCYDKHTYEYQYIDDINNKDIANTNKQRVKEKNKEKQGNKQQHKYKFKIAKQYIVGIDAINFNASDQDQFSQQSVLMQLSKACLGFSVCEQSKWVVSGNWGCGVFGGNVQLKIIIQWIAASLNGKHLRYCPFGSKTIVYNQRLLSMLSKLSLKQIVQILIKCSNQLSLMNNSKTYNLRSRQTTNNITLYQLLQKQLK